MTASKIAELNDRFRMSLGIPALGGDVPGKVVVTAGVAALSLDVQSAILNKVREFSDFNADNDPRGEHDFGAFDQADHAILWKIDYYAPDLLHGSGDPADPCKTVRILTVMLAAEW